MRKYITRVIFVALITFIVGHGAYFVITQTQNQKMEENHDRARALYDAMPPWHKKIKTDQELKIGLITDTHVRPKRIERSDERDDAPRELKDDQKEPLERFVAQMQIFVPDLIVHLGDVIEGTGDDHYIGSKGVQLVQKELEILEKPIYWVAGNHDLRALTKEQFRQILAIESLDQVFDIGDYRLIIIDANYNLEDQPRSPDGNTYIRGKLPQKSLEWLENQFKTDKRVILFMHQGSFTTDSVGDPKDEYRNLYDEGDRLMEGEEISGVEYHKKQSIVNAQDLNDLLQAYRVDAVFNGHMEARRFDVIGPTMHYSLTGTKKSYTYPRSFYELTLKNGKPDVMMYYVPVGEDEIRVIDFEGV